MKMTRHFFSNITAQQLKRCHVTWNGEDLGKTVVFPFFDDHGTVTGYMLITNEDKLFLGADAYQGSIRKLLGWRLTFRGFQLERKCFLSSWHYDPWWLLKTPKLAQEDEPLTHTNIVPYLPKKISSFVYKRKNLQPSHYLDGNLSTMDIVIPTTKYVTPPQTHRERATWQLNAWWI